MAVSTANPRGSLGEAQSESDGAFFVFGAVGVVTACSKKPCSKTVL
jgi:hypothetical protein